MRIEVEVFAREMEDRLRANDHKGGWKSCTRGYLLRRLRTELRELVSALNRRGADYDSSEVVSEAADVANFAMMIADTQGRMALNASARDWNR